MISVNEEIFISSMIDEGIDKKTIKSLLRKFKGWRIYFRNKISEYEDIRSDYKQMIKAYHTRASAVKALAVYYEKSENRINEVISNKRVMQDDYV